MGLILGATMPVKAGCRPRPLHTRAGDSVRVPHLDWHFNHRRGRPRPEGPGPLPVLFVPLYAPLHSAMTRRSVAGEPVISLRTLGRLALTLDSFHHPHPPDSVHSFVAERFIAYDPIGELMNSAPISNRNSAASPHSYDVTFARRRAREGHIWLRTAHHQAWNSLPGIKAKSHRRISNPPPVGAVAPVLIVTVSVDTVHCEGIQIAKKSGRNRRRPPMYRQGPCRCL